jgi:hypothetical protein
VPYLHCPQCGLVIDARGRVPLVEHCPRCVARSRTLVELVVSGRPRLRNDASQHAESPVGTVRTVREVAETKRGPRAD